MELVLTILMVLAAIVLIATVLLQSSESDGMGALAGGSETFFGKNKNSTFEGKMAMATKISAAKIATAAGVTMVIANGQDPTVLYDIVEGRPVGTRFLAQEVDR